MPQNKIWIVAYVYGGFVENVFVFSDRGEADDNFDKISEEIDPEKDDVKMYEVSLNTLDETVVRSYFGEHPEA